METLKSSWVLPALNGDMIVHYDPASGIERQWELTGSKQDNGYRVTQAVTYSDGGTNSFAVFCGATLLDAVLSGDSNLVSSAVNYQCSYAFNDIWQDPDSGKILLASAQSGGSCIHVLDPQHPDWRADFETIEPPGKIAAILTNTAQVWTNLASFSKPAWERNPVEVILTAADPTHPVAQSIQGFSSTPAFLNYTWGQHRQDPLDWDRDTVLADNPEYRDKRDNRSPYDWTQSQILDYIAADDDGGTGRALWGRPWQ